MVTIDLSNLKFRVPVVPLTSLRAFKLIGVFAGHSHTRTNVTRTHAISQLSRSHVGFAASFLLSHSHTRPPLPFSFESCSLSFLVSKGWSDQEKDPGIGKKWQRSALICGA